MEEMTVLEPAAAEVCKSSSKPPLIFQLPPKQGRRVLEEVQSSPVVMYPADVRHITMDTGKWGKIRVYVVIPKQVDCAGNVIFYIHGAGWVFGSYHTHEKLVRELAVRTGSVLVFPEYTRSPEAKYPVAIAMTFMAKYRHGPFIQKQLLYYPVTNACFNTASYCRYAAGYYLYRAGMMWFWNQYTTSEKDRNQITASPLRAETEQLKGLPAAMILNGEADVLRDEGEAYANKLRAAGVDVTAMRFQGIIHDFVMLNALDQTKACRAAMDASVSWINRKNCINKKLP